ncbi:MAG: peptidoglycan-binding domain-containing protein, partial [Planctomycetota bacterium]
MAHQDDATFPDEQEPTGPAPERRHLSEKPAAAPRLEEVKSGLGALSEGMQGRAVREVQKLLNDTGTQPPLRVDGNFGPRTTAAYARFQARQHKPTTGVVDRVWIRVLDKAAKDYKASERQGKRAAAKRVPGYQGEERISHEETVTAESLVKGS